MVTTNGIFLIDNTNRILLVHATNSSWNQWSVPKGLVNAGETSIDAAMRELKEETNVDLYKLMKKYGYEYHYLGTKDYRSGKKVIEGHLVKINTDLSNHPLSCESMITHTNTPECDKFTWYELTEGINIMHESQSRLLKEYLKL